MGGLAARIPQTFRTMIVATVAIAGIFPLAGFFSKDQILGSARGRGPLGPLSRSASFTAGLTAFYMFRLVSDDVLRRGRAAATRSGEHVHESPATMTVPLWILAAVSVVAGFLGVPAALGGSDRIGRFLEASVAHPAIHEISHATRDRPHAALRRRGRRRASPGPGAGTAKPTGRPRSVAPQAHAFYEKTGALGRLVANKWNVDEGIEALVLSPFRKIGTFLWRGFDALFIDGIANASAFLVELTGDLLRFFTTGQRPQLRARASRSGSSCSLVYVWVR